MGSKHSKYSDNNSQHWPDNVATTSTLPASFRRKGQDISKTGSLPRNAGSVNKNFDRGFNNGATGHQSFGQKIRKSCRNWAAQRGLVQKPVQKCSNNGETPAVVNQNIEDNTTEEVSDDTNKTAEISNEVDIAAIVAALVVEKHKKKMASRAQSRAQSKEVLLDEDNNNQVPNEAYEGTISQESQDTRVLKETDDNDATANGNSDASIHKHETNDSSIIPKVENEAIKQEDSSEILDTDNHKNDSDGMKQEADECEDNSTNEQETNDSESNEFCDEVSKDDVNVGNDEELDSEVVERSSDSVTDIINEIVESVAGSDENSRDDSDGRVENVD